MKENNHLFKNNSPQEGLAWLQPVPSWLQVAIATPSMVYPWRQENVAVCPSDTWLPLAGTAGSSHTEKCKHIEAAMQFKNLIMHMK